MDIDKTIFEIITSATWHIDPAYGLQELAKLKSELGLASNGASHSELGIGERRSASRQITLINDEGMSVATDAREAVVNASTGSIAKLSVTGVMRADDGLCSRGISSFAEDLAILNASSTIRGFLIEVRSGGGESTAGDIMFAAMQNLKKPAVVYTHLLGSAALHGALPAKEIWASNNGAVIGSIGTMMTLQKKFADWYNENLTDVYAEQSTKKNDWFREYLQGNLEPLKKFITKDAAMFIKDVQSSRKLNKELESTTLNGDVFFAGEAKKRGLIDGVGTMDTAIKRLKNYF